MVCTDVIGHGLNLPLDAVLFISTSKWDGRRMRPLHLWELAQIAGRAGRGNRRPGTVYTLRISGCMEVAPTHCGYADVDVALVPEPLQAEGCGREPPSELS